MLVYTTVRDEIVMLSKVFWKVGKKKSRVEVLKLKNESRDLLLYAEIFHLQNTFY